MKKVYKILLSIFVLFILFMVNGCSKPITLTIEQTNIEMFIDESYVINPIVENFENPFFDIQCDSDVITIEGNTITGVKEGSCTVIIALKDNPDVPSVALYIKVKNIIPEKINCIDSIDIMIGESYTVEYSFEPEKAIADVKFQSKDTAIATVNTNGKIKGQAAGKTVVVISIDVEGVTVSKEIEVSVRGTDLPTVSFAADYKDTIIVNWGSKFDAFTGITVTDVEDGDITANLKLVSEPDVQEYGKQVIEYTVSDRDGNTSTFERTIEVVWNYDVQFIGHAGSYFGLMNSEEAILYAIRELKYQCVEVDLKQTKDGVFVLCHDDTFGDYTIASTNWSTLKDYTVTKSRKGGIPFTNGDAKGDGMYTAGLCTLERYLEICKEYNVTAVIELKSSSGISNSNQSRMQALMDEIEKAEMLENVIFLASAYNCLIWTRENGYDYIPCQYLVSSIESETSLQRCIDNNLDISTNTTYGGSNSDEWIARYKEAGIKISTYTYTQYVDYDVVQQWIDKGVDFLTCDWQKMDKLKLPVSSNEPKVKYNVKFVDHDGTILKERQVEQGNTAAAPSVPERKGYDFIGWDKELKNIQSDMVFTAQYNPSVYSITYMANLDIVTEGSWATKDEFVNEFYNDLFEWIKLKGTEIDGLSISGSQYTLTRNGKTATFSSAADIKTLDLYVFEKTISNILYKPVTRGSDGTCTIVEDNNYFLNSSQYRVKYQGMDQWLYNCAKVAYQSYDTSFKPLSDGRIQIFFRMHQWMKGTTIAAFDKYPIKYIVEADKTVNPVLPTSPISYTVLDEVTLPSPTGNAKFLGWYLTADCSGDAVTKISTGTTGNIVLYAKWEK